MTNKAHMKQHAADAINWSIATSVWASYLAGWSINEWAAAGALFYSILLILDKLGILSPMRSVFVSGCRWCWRKVRFQ